MESILLFYNNLCHLPKTHRPYPTRSGKVLNPKSHTQPIDLVAAAPGQNLNLKTTRVYKAIFPKLRGLYILIVCPALLSLKTRGHGIAEMVRRTGL